VSDEVRIEVDSGGTVRRIVLNRPDKRNALTREMFATLTEAFSTADGGERVTVLSAEGPVFCAGVDLGERAGNDARPGASPLELLCAAVWDYPQPVVAVVQGHAIGGGFMLAMHCDFVIAAREARMGNAAVQMGLVTPWSGARRVLEAVGAPVSRRLLLMGELVPAGELAAARVIAAAVVAEELPGASEKLVARLAGNAPLSLRAIKATLNAPSFIELPDPRAQELIALAQASEDSREGVAARRERRAPQFTGR
jgi:enoyl-CoA hydratase/carnithine racemase